MMRGPGESKMQIFIKDSMTKMVFNSDFLNSITITNNVTNTVTLLTEAQGEKTGYTTTEADRKDQARIMDSVAKENANNAPAQGGIVIRTGGGQSNVKEISYTADTKKINGIDCKKAIVTMQDNENKLTTIDVWYTDAYTLPEGAFKGGRGMMNFGNLNGVPVQYATQRKISAMGRETTITTTFIVNEIKQNATIEDKEFAIPKGYKVKSYTDWKKDNPNGTPTMRMSMRVG